MIDVDDDHLGGTTRCAARFDRAGCPIADLEETHQAGRASTTGQPLIAATQHREVGASAGTVLEQAGFTHPQVHDAVLVDEIVLDRLDEARMRLWMFVGRCRRCQNTGLMVDIVMSLAGAIDAVRPVQAGVEPLRAVRCTVLHGEHVAVLVEKRAGIFLGSEIAALPTPIRPRTGETIEHLARVNFAACSFFLGEIRKRCLVWHRAPQPRRHLRFFDLAQALWHAGFAEIFLGENVGRDLAPMFRHHDAVELEDDRTIRVLDLAEGATERNDLVG